MMLRITLSRILTMLLVVSLALTVIVNHTRRQRHMGQQDIEALLRTRIESRAHLMATEQGISILQLVELTPAMPHDADCHQFLRRSLADSVLLHWEREAGIDEAVDTRGYAKSFAAQAMRALGCQSTDDLVSLSNTRLWADPDHELRSVVSPMSRTRRVAFDAFIHAARASDGGNGG